MHLPLSMQPGFLAHPINHSPTDTLNAALLSFQCTCQVTPQLCMGPAICWPPTVLKLHEKVTLRQAEADVGGSCLHPQLGPRCCPARCSGWLCFCLPQPLFPPPLLSSLTSRLCPLVNSELTLPPNTPSSWGPSRASSLTLPPNLCKPAGIRPILFTSFAVTEEEVSFLQNKVNPPLHCGAQPLSHFRNLLLILMSSILCLCPFFTGSFSSALKCT